MCTIVMVPMMFVHHTFEEATNGFHWIDALRLTMCVSLATSTSSAAPSATSFTVSSSLSLISEKCIIVLFDVCLSVRHVLINDSEHNFWALVWLVDLEHSVLMTFSFFAHGAVVKVFAHTALISDTNNWDLSAAIAGDVLMDDGEILILLFVLTKLSHVHHIIKDLLALLVELFLDDLLEALSRKASEVFIFLRVTLDFLLALGFVIRIGASAALFFRLFWIHCFCDSILDH